MAISIAEEGRGNTHFAHSVVQRNKSIVPFACLLCGPHSLCMFGCVCPLSSCWFCAGLVWRKQNVAAVRCLLWSLICPSATVSACNTYHSTPSHLFSCLSLIRLRIDWWRSTTDQRMLTSLSDKCRSQSIIWLPYHEQERRVKTKNYFQRKLDDRFETCVTAFVPTYVGFHRYLSFA